MAIRTFDLLSYRWVFLLLMCVAGIDSAAAEGRCPPGQYPIGDQGVGGCAPIPGAAGQGGTQATGHWVTTWGAIAKDEKPTRDTNLAIGVAESVATKEEAGRIAVSRCVQTGGNDCQVLLAYHNQCAALSGPDISQLSARGGVLNASGAGSLEKAKETSIRRCQAEDGGQSCMVVYAACSVPHFVED